MPSNERYEKELERKKNRRFQVRMYRWYPRKSAHDLIYLPLLTEEKAIEYCEIENKKAAKAHRLKNIPLLRYYVFEKPLDEIV